MNTPFSAAANAVLQMYVWRQERPTEHSPAHSPAEIDWAADRLLDLALVAAYAGSKEAKAIKEMAELWKGNKHMRITSDFFTTDKAELPQ